MRHRMLAPLAVSLLLTTVCLAYPQDEAEPAASAPVGRLDEVEGVTPGAVHAPTAQPPISLDAAAAARIEINPAPDSMCEAIKQAWTPDLRDPAFLWISAVLSLALLAQWRRGGAMRSVDACVLAVMALLIPTRQSLSTLEFNVGGMDLQKWVYALFAAAALYWIIRGFVFAFGKTTPRFERNASGGALGVLCLAGVALGLVHLLHAPLSAASRDGLIGGAVSAQTGMLPYGDAEEHDARSPLLYYAHAGAIRLFPDQAVVPVTTDGETRLVAVGERAARAVNIALFALMVGALALIGQRRNAMPVGLTLVAVFCFFPGVVDCLSRPEIMLPATLLAWTIAFAKFPIVGGLLATLTLVMAGLAWPWAWLAAPVLLAYFFRRGWQAFFATLGLLGGVAATLAGFTFLTRPTLPRADGALASAGLAPEYTATLTEGGVIMTASQPARRDAAGLFAPVWRFLLERESASVEGGGRPVFYRYVDADASARTELQSRYREEMAAYPPATRMWVGLRSVLESVWTPATARESELPRAWPIWQGDQDPQRWLLIRRIAKGAVGLLAIVLAWLLWRAPRFESGHLAAGLLILSAATLLISQHGPAVNLVWLMPAILALVAAYTEPEAVAAPPRRPDPHILERMANKPPRISVEQ